MTWRSWLARVVRRRQDDALDTSVEAFLWDASLPAPDAEVEELATRLKGLRFQSADPSAEVRSLRQRASSEGSFSTSRGPRWLVVPTSGVPHIGSSPSYSRASIRVGEWLTTDAFSTARIRVGTIGTAEIGTNSRVSVRKSRPGEYRLGLAQGSLHARIWAPPRFFLVETPGGLAIDLGCVYTLDVDAGGNGVLNVQSGQVELVHHGFRSLVYAGSTARLRADGPPGLPVRTDANAKFREACVRFEAEPGREHPGHFEALLESADSRSAITLWHLLSRVDAGRRARVIGSLAALAPLPRGIDRASIASLDPRSLDRWRRALEPLWTDEQSSVWHRAWRRLWQQLRHSS